MNGSQIAQAAKEQIAELTGFRANAVSALSHDESGWHASVDVVELKRIPAGTDVLGTYEVLLDEAGNLLSYKRVRRYYRGAVEETS